MVARSNCLCWNTGKLKADIFSYWPRQVQPPSHALLLILRNHRCWSSLTMNPWLNGSWCFIPSVALIRNFLWHKVRNNQVESWVFTHIQGLSFQQRGAWVSWEKAAQSLHKHPTLTQGSDRLSYALEMLWVAFPETLHCLFSFSLGQIHLRPAPVSSDWAGELHPAHSNVLSQGLAHMSIPARNWSHYPLQWYVCLVWRETNKYASCTGIIVGAKWNNDLGVKKYGICKSTTSWSQMLQIWQRQEHPGFGRLSGHAAEPWDTSLN